MNNQFKLIAFFMLVASTVSASATLLLTENFNYPDGSLTLVGSPIWYAHSSQGINPLQVTNNQIKIRGLGGEDVSADLSGAPYATNSGVILYSRYSLIITNDSELPNNTGGFISHFKNAGTGTSFHGRVFLSRSNASTKVLATPGNYFIGIGNFAGSIGSLGVAEWPNQLSTGFVYTVVTKCDLANNQSCSLWIDPLRESDPNVTASDYNDPTNQVPISSYAFRQNNNAGTNYVDAVAIGTSFADVIGDVTTPIILSVAQRPGTTYLDVDFKVKDPNDESVSVAALGFVNGGDTLADIIKVTTLVEGTGVNLGTNIPANTNLHLTWNVAADWNTNFGSVLLDILAKDGRGLLPFHWVTLPAHGADPMITINSRPIYDADLLPVWYWLLATGDPGIILSNGAIYCTTGDFANQMLASGTATTVSGRGYLGAKMNFRPITASEINRASAGPYGNQSVFESIDVYSVVRSALSPTNRIFGWGDNGAGQLDYLPGAPWIDIRRVALGTGFTIICDGQFVVGWGANNGGQLNFPSSATNVIAVAAGDSHGLALRADGLVVGWGHNDLAQIEIPASATNVTAIAAGFDTSFALRGDGTIVGWGGTWNGSGVMPASIPETTNAIAIAAGRYHALAIQADHTIVAAGNNDYGQIAIPDAATNIVAIACGQFHSLALRADGSVFAWGHNDYGQLDVPASATNITAITAGMNHSVALRDDGTVVVWGNNQNNLTNVPPSVGSIDLLGIGCAANHVVVVDKLTP